MTVKNTIVIYSKYYSVFEPFCHGAHSREEQGHADEDVNSNNSL